MVNLRNRSELGTCTHLVDRVKNGELQPDFYKRELRQGHVTRLVSAFEARDDITDFAFKECEFPEDGLPQLLSALHNQRLTRFVLAGYNFSDEDFSLILQTIKEQDALCTLDLSNNKLTDAQQSQLIDVLREHPSLKNLNLNNGTLTDHGAKELGEALPAMKATHLYLRSNPRVAQKGMTALLEGVIQSPSIELLDIAELHLKEHHGEQILTALKNKHSPLRNIDLSNCGLQDADQMVEMALAALQRPNMVRLSLLGKTELTEQHHRTLDACASHTQHKNLTALTIGNIGPIALKRLCRNNSNAAMKLADQLDLVWQKRTDATVSLLAEFHSRLPLLHMTQVGRIHVFLPMLQSLPGLENVQHADDLLRTNEAGFTPLDNPANWQQFPALAAELAAQGTPVTSTHLMTPNKDDNPSLCSALHNPQFSVTLARLNQSGIQFTGGELLDEQGEPSTLVSYAHEHGHLAAFFTQDNWRGRHPAELAYVYRHLPEEMQHAIPNFFGLQTALQREARTQQGAERSA